jgi:signal transduction histidine kinase
MAVVGGLGAISGLVVGFGVARTLTRSIRKLQVQIGDAADKLGPRMPQIVLTPDGDFQGLHEQVDHLAGRIEAVVAVLQEREREVRRAEQLAAVGQLAAGVAHEVRNPLTSIKMLVQLALEQNTQLPPEDLGVIDGEIRKMENSLRAFLNFATPPKAERRPVNLLDVVAAVLGLIRGRSEKQNVTVKVSDSGQPVLVTADPDQLRQVLVNLTLNALDAMPTGGNLHLVIRESPKKVEVEVADTGLGIAAEMAPKLFQPFASGKDTGVGLGLVISLRIAEAHGGTLTGSNSANGGAIFTLTLPRN